MNNIDKLIQHLKEGGYEVTLLPLNCLIRHKHFPDPGFSDVAIHELIRLSDFAVFYMLSGGYYGTNIIVYRLVQDIAYLRFILSYSLRDYSTKEVPFFLDEYATPYSSISRYLMQRNELTSNTDKN